MKRPWQRLSFVGLIKKSLSAGRFIASSSTRSIWVRIDFRSTSRSFRMISFDLLPTSLPHLRLLHQGTEIQSSNSSCTPDRRVHQRSSRPAKLRNTCNAHRPSFDANYKPGRIWTSNLSRRIVWKSCDPSSGSRMRPFGSCETSFRR